jgi:hypothetical protein
MNRYARTASSEALEFISIQRPFSFFHIAETRFTGCDPLRRLFSQVRMLQGKTLVVETLKEPDDLREENEDLRKRDPSLNSNAYRLSFFSKSFATSRGLAAAGNEDFLGYVILKQDTMPIFGSSHRVYESVIKNSRYPNNFVRGQQTWKCRIAGNQFEVDGYIYAQQNGITNVCAHVALRTAAARFHNAGDMSYREMNDLLGIDHKTFTVESGLNVDQMAQVLRKRGPAFSMRVIHLLNPTHLHSRNTSMAVLKVGIQR